MQTSASSGSLGGAAGGGEAAGAGEVEQARAAMTEAEKAVSCWGKVYWGAVEGGEVGCNGRLAEALGSGAGRALW